MTFKLLVAILVNSNNSGRIFESIASYTNQICMYISRMIFVSVIIDIFLNDLFHTESDVGCSLDGNLGDPVGISSKE